jgi:hypothetical protein
MHGATIKIIVDVLLKKLKFSSTIGFMTTRFSLANSC